jgi:phosphoribosylanthranilate isomerase
MVSTAPKILVKICGITNAPDARAAVDAGANLLGFNFYPKSPRFVARADAAKIRTQLPRQVEPVGLFVNATPEDILAMYSVVRFTMAQLHGDEPATVVAELARVLRVIKAFRAGADFAAGMLDEYGGASAFLLDAAALPASAGQYGGTGRRADWDVARQAATRHRIILAGGLKVENVAEAIRSVRPDGVDVASGVETKPGRKDHGLLREFIAEVRRAEKQMNTQEMSAKP